MINLSWGGYQNGAIPASAMSPIDSAGHVLESAAAARFLAMQAAMLHDLGRTISVAPGSDSAFRTVAQQQADYRLYQQGGNVAAIPGTSNHGWGRAVDITGYESSTAVWNWLLAHAAEYGFSWATGQASGERWHWESLTPPGTVVADVSSTPLATPTTEQDYTMTQGAFYRLNDGEPALGNLVAGTILHQESPGEPLLPITYEEWLGWSSNKNTYTSLTTQQLQSLLHVVGLYDTDGNKRRVPAVAGRASFGGFSVYLA